jgi:2-C-methyl-D-erythritol 2,4-cyclodiphosphate synthase
MKIRTGIGLDVHPFESGRKFILGGVEIPHYAGLKGHSDADALIHAMIDALLGAAGLKDIGTYFPDNKEEFKNINSILLLKRTVQLIREKNFTIGNIDTVICLQEPKVAPYIDEMKTVLSEAMEIETDDISIKATTFEHMGFVGEKEGILCIANVLLYSTT